MSVLCKDGGSPRGSQITPRHNSGQKSPIISTRKLKPSEAKTKPRLTMIGPSDIKLIDQNHPSQETIIKIEDDNSNERSYD